MRVGSEMMFARSSNPNQYEYSYWYDKVQRIIRKFPHPAAGYSSVSFKTNKLTLRQVTVAYLLLYIYE